MSDKRNPYLEPIARSGEEQFACVLRNRSGMDSGCIDFGARSITHLSEPEQQEAVEMAYSIYSKWRDETGKKSTREGAPAIPLEPTPAMIEAGAQRLVRWEDGCVWPDSWSKMDVRASRNDAERVWRSMYLAALDAGKETKA